MMAAAKVFGFAGRSGSGKTTLIEAMLPLLRARGLTVNVIKHSHHDIALEPPGKDSARFRAAGAQEVMIASPYRFAIVHELNNQPEPDLREQLARLAPADLTLVEGFKHDDIPRLEVYRAATQLAPLFAEPGFDCVAVASDSAKPTQAAAGLTWLPLNEPATIAAFVCRYLQLAE